MKSFVLVFLFVGLFVFCGCEDEDEDRFLSVAPMVKKEQEALYSAIQGFVGKYWIDSYLYPDPCGWTPIQGVYCDLVDGYWHVTVLNIGLVFDNSLRCSPDAKFTDHMFELVRLRSLSFFGCFSSPRDNPIEIPSSNWERFSNSLESLEYRSNGGLIGAIPTSIGYLKKLQSLVLLENRLTGELPIELGNLVNLKQLVLAGNQFSGRIPPSFGGLTELLIMELSGNKLSGSLMSSFGSNFSSMLKLDLSNNGFKGNIPEGFGSLKNVTLLYIGRNKFSVGLIQSFQEMVLSYNPLGGDLMGIRWENLQNLEILNISNLGLTGSIPESTAGMRRLRYLGLNDNNLSGNLSPKLASLPCLGALYINGNNLAGKLEFSQRFYKKMGRRFKAWNNSKLCYQAQMISSSSPSSSTNAEKNLYYEKFKLFLKCLSNAYSNKYTNNGKYFLESKITHNLHKILTNKYKSRFGHENEQTITN